MDATKVVQLSAGRIHYRDSGDGPPVVFVHGLLTSGSLWRNVTAALEGEARCIAPDWPLGSHPESMNADADVSPRGVARLVAEFIEALGLSDVTLVANDTGGAVAQIVATEHPDRIGALVLTSCDCFDNFPPAMFRPLVEMARFPALLNGAVQPMRIRRMRSLPIAYGLVAKRGIPDAVTDEWLKPALTDRAVRRDTAKLLRGMDKRVTLEAAERLGGFDRPALVVWAGDDRLFPLDYGRRLAELLPQGRFETVADSYTFISEDQPGPLADLIRSFLRERTAGATA